MSSEEAEEIASNCLYQKDQFHIQVSQTKHRLQLLSRWNICKGMKVLELGCGQGDCTAVLAAAVGEEGHVTGVDPADLQLGTPFTIGEAQNHLANSKLGKQISFYNADPIEFLHSHTHAVYDVAVLAHCIWYFDSPEVVKYTLQVLSQRVKRICISEYSLSASNPLAMAHVHAALARAALESRKEESISNVRTVLSPSRIKNMSSQLGLVLDTESLLTPIDELSDGKFEVKVVLDPPFEEEIDRFIEEEKEKSVLLALRDAVEARTRATEGGWKGVKTMDVWTGIFLSKDNEKK
eukprot:TRINITY_DN5896_c0_g1_i2.p1 TRINITY_DN5896_c0_g1~~TRINITY_DN5896_c0_g1_i2.p1  ORF type:complete len:294 (-),score=87.90 TRINITY_DN5896_c0_g1_i2:109-990(-)